METDDRAVAEYVRGSLQRHGSGAASRVGLELPGGDVPDVDVLERVVGHVVLVRIDLEE